MDDSQSLITNLNTGERTLQKPVSEEAIYKQLGVAEQKGEVTSPEVAEEKPLHFISPR